MKVFFGSSIPNHQRQAFMQTKIQNSISLNLKIDRFSDGEILPLFKESVRDHDVFLIQSITNHDFIFETILTIDAAKRAGCKSFTLVSPFLPYSRQDKTDHLRSSIGSKALAVTLESVGLSRLITIDLHSSSIQGFFQIPVIHLNGNKIFIDFIRKQGLDNLCIVSPDQGAVKRASDFCKVFPDASFAMINKKRIKPNEIHSMELVGDVTGKNVIIVDDMTDTGGTLAKSAALIMKMGANSVSSIATHGVLSGEAASILDSSVLNNVYVSDSIPSTYLKSELIKKLRVVSCVDIIANSIDALCNHESINSINAVY
jgi:ribose-phosphate pyrophosphokinase